MARRSDQATPAELSAATLDEAVRATDEEVMTNAITGADKTAHRDDDDDRQLEGKLGDLEGSAYEDGDDDPAGDDQAEAGGNAGEAEAKAGDADAAGEGDEPEARGGPTLAQGDQPGQPPSGRLRESGERAREAEGRREAAEARASTLEAQLRTEREERQALARRIDALTAPPPKRVEPKPRPDKFADPDGYDAWVEGQISQVRSDTLGDVNQRLINQNLNIHASIHGEKFDQAYNALVEDAKTSPQTQAEVRRIMAAENPGAEIMSWHRNREVQREVGPDLAAYRERLRRELLADPEFRKDREGGADNPPTNGRGPAVRHVTRGPVSLPSLNRASGRADRGDATFDDTSDGSFLERSLAGLHPRQQ